MEKTEYSIYKNKSVQNYTESRKVNKGDPPGGGVGTKGGKEKEK